MKARCARVLLGEWKRVLRKRADLMLFVMSVDRAFSESEVCARVAG